jgi:hypothetical protein
MIALVARYQRQGHPRKRHPAFAALPKEARRTVRAELLAESLARPLRLDLPAQAAPLRRARA